MSSYKVLSEDNIDELVGFTGLPKQELTEMLEKSKNFGHQRCFWRVGNRYFSVAISDEIVYRDNDLDRVMQNLIEDSVYAISNGKDFP
jgi:hypothetical protein